MRSRGFTGVSMRRVLVVLSFAAAAGFVCGQSAPVDAAGMKQAAIAASARVVVTNCLRACRCSGRNIPSVTHATAS